MGSSVREFDTAEAARLVGVSPSTLRRLARQGWVAPRHDPRGRPCWCFEQIVTLRRVVALSPIDRRAARAGQLALPLGGATQRVERVAPSDGWYDQALSAERTDPERAAALYARGLAARPDHARALVNLGRLLHARGELDAAMQHYRRAVQVEPALVTAWFNLGVALQDVGRWTDALQIYRGEVLTREPDHADAHFNAARLCERLGDQLGAVRHLGHHRRRTD